MTNKEIFFKAIKKAQDQGYKPPFLITEDWDFDWIEEGKIFEVFDGSFFIRYHINEIIFNHEFAKAFWGDIFKEDDINIYGTLCSLYFWRWQLHLSSVVLEKDPLKYIEKYL